MTLVSGRRGVQAADDTAHTCHHILLRLLTRRKRACLVTLINTVSGLFTSTSYDPKVVHLSVVYGCDLVASFAAL